MRLNRSQTRRVQPRASPTQRSNSNKNETENTRRKMNKSKSQPRILITKKDSLELVTIMEDNAIRNRLESDDGSDSVRSGETRLTSTTGAEENGSMLSGWQRVDSFKTPVDKMHFPVPSEASLKIYEELYLQVAQIYENTSSVCSHGDPTASRLLSFLSAVCFDLDYSLRYTLQLHPLEDLISETDDEDDRSVVSSAKSTKSMMHRVLALGSAGRVAERMIALGEKSVLVDDKCKEVLFILGNYSPELCHMPHLGFAALSRAFARIGELSANFANKLYGGTGLFNIFDSPIPLHRLSFDEVDLDFHNPRLERKAFIDFMNDADESFKKCIQVFNILRGLWSSWEQRPDSERRLNFNDFEKTLLALERSNASFFSTTGRPERFVQFVSQHYALPTGAMNLQVFWEEFEVYPSAADSAPKIQKFCERLAMERRFKRGAVLNLNAILVMQIREKSIAAKIRKTRSTKTGRKRAFARKLRATKP